MIINYYIIKLCKLNFLLKLLHIRNVIIKMRSLKVKSDF